MRLVQGRHGWWALARRGNALVPNGLVHDGELTEHGRREIEQLGLDIEQDMDAYHVTVLTSTNCNLGCPYCFQNTGAAEPGRFNPPRIARAALTTDVIDSIATTVRDRMADLGVGKLTVLLFGGEPLLNPIGCKEALRRLGALGDMSGAMISNGVLLRERLARELFDLGLRSVQITFDGPAELHDTVRTTRNGGATFDRILTNIAAAQRVTDIGFKLRINVTRAALSGIDPLLDEIAGRIDPTRCILGIAPVLDYGWGFDGLGTAEESAGRIIGGYARALGHGFSVARPRLPYCAFCSQQRGVHGLTVNADGTLYSCWESVGRPGYEVGTIADGYSDYTPDKWVTCGDFADGAGSADRARFTDAVTAGLLDLLRERRLAGAGV